MAATLVAAQSPPSTSGSPATTRRGKPLPSDIFSITDDELAAQFAFEEEVGSGNWGSIWRCTTKPAANRVRGIVGVKLVHRDKSSPTNADTSATRVRALWSEYRTLRSLRLASPGGTGHAHILKVSSFAITPSYALFTMVMHPKALQVGMGEGRTARRWMKGLVEGVAWLHSKGVSHNDVKPANVVVSAKGQAVLIDFGFAVSYGAGWEARDDAFWSQVDWGTPEYLSPQRASKQWHDERLSDLWAVGVTLYEIVVGRTPFEISDTEEFLTAEALKVYYERTLERRFFGEYHISSDLAIIIKSMLEPELERRMPSVSDVALNLYFEPSSPPSSAKGAPKVDSFQPSTATLSTGSPVRRRIAPATPTAVTPAKPARVAGLIQDSESTQTPRRTTIETKSAWNPRSAIGKASLDTRSPTATKEIGTPVKVPAAIKVFEDHLDKFATPTRSGTVMRRDAATPRSILAERHTRNLMATPLESKTSFKKFTPKEAEKINKVVLPLAAVKLNEVKSAARQVGSNRTEKENRPVTIAANNVEPKAVVEPISSAAPLQLIVASVSVVPGAFQSPSRGGDGSGKKKCDFDASAEAKKTTEKPMQKLRRKLANTPSPKRMISSSSVTPIRQQSTSSSDRDPSPLQGDGITSPSPVERAPSSLRRLASMVTRRHRPTSVASETTFSVTSSRRSSICQPLPSQTACTSSSATTATKEVTDPVVAFKAHMEGIVADAQKSMYCESPSLMARRSVVRTGSPSTLQDNDRESLVGRTKLPIRLQELARKAESTRTSVDRTSLDTGCSSSPRVTRKSSSLWRSPTVKRIVSDPQQNQVASSSPRLAPNQGHEVTPIDLETDDTITLKFPGKTPVKAVQQAERRDRCVHQTTSSGSLPPSPRRCASPGSSSTLSSRSPPSASSPIFSEESEGNRSIGRATTFTSQESMYARFIAATPRVERPISRSVSTPLVDLTPKVEIEQRRTCSTHRHLSTFETLQRDDDQIEEIVDEPTTTTTPNTNGEQNLSKNRTFISLKKLWNPKKAAN